MIAAIYLGLFIWFEGSNLPELIRSIVSKKASPDEAAKRSALTGQTRGRRRPLGQPSGRPPHGPGSFEREVRRQPPGTTHGGRNSFRGGTSSTARLLAVLASRHRSPPVRHLLAHLRTTLCHEHGAGDLFGLGDWATTFRSAWMSTPTFTRTCSKRRLRLATSARTRALR